MSETRSRSGNAGRNSFFSRRKKSAPNNRSNSAPRAKEHPKAPPEEASVPTGENVFKALIPELQRALEASGYTQPTPVQELCIPHLVEGRDLLASAQTGTGKTAAFTLPLLQTLSKSSRRPERLGARALILAPTRELAAQIGDSIETYGKHLNLTHTVIFGGVGQNAQERAMKRGVDFLVATPGRLLDLMNQRLIDLRTVEAFVLDEADRMLDMGFIRDVRKVIAQLPKRRHSLFFSATLSREIVELANSMLDNPKRVTIAPERPTVDRIDQKVMFVDKGNKDALLVSLLRDKNVDKVIIFTQTKRLANKVADKLEDYDITASAIHGNKSQTARTKALEGFRAGRVRALVATDIAARGIDVDGVTHVINYHMPVEPETYVHRIGRTARAGADGDAVTFCAADERDQLRAIERLIKKEVPMDDTHEYHSDVALNATGAEARPVPKGQRGGGGGRRGGGRGGNNKRRATSPAEANQARAVASGGRNYRSSAPRRRSGGNRGR